MIGNKPIFMYDWDDVCVDFVGALNAWHNKTYQTSFRKEDYSSFAFWEIWGGNLEEAVQKVRDFFMSEDGGKTRPIEGAVETLSKLEREGCWQYVLTSRFPGSRNLVFEQRSRDFPTCFKEILFSRNSFAKSGVKSKVELCQELGADIFVEDYLHYALPVANAGIRVLLFDQPWNRKAEAEGVKNLVRVYSWKDVDREVRKRLN